MLSKIALVLRKSNLERRLLLLQNGLKVILHNMPHRKAATVGLWLPIGSAVESEAEAGYSHFVEHMLFKGTKRRSYSDIAREIDRLGGYMNASTSREVTNYYVTLSGRYLLVALDILADMYFESQFQQKDFATEKKVILEELRMSQDDPDDYVFDLFFENAYPKNSLGRPIGGNFHSISEATRKKLLAYYHRNYGTQGAVLSLAGCLYRNYTQWRELEKNIYRLFDRQDHPLSGTPSLTTISYPQKLSEQIFHKAKKLEQVHFILGLPGEPFQPNGFAELIVFNNLIGGTMSSRLFRKLREEHGLCYSVGSSTHPYYRTGLWSLYCGTSKENFLQAVTLAVEELRNSLLKPLSGEEVQENIQNIVGSLELSMENQQFHARYNALGMIYWGKLPDWENILKEYEAVSPQAIMSKMHALWQGCKLTLASLGDLPPKKVLSKIANLLSQPIL